MRSYHVDEGAGIDGLKVRQHEVPVPGPGQVLVAVRAVSLSYRELLVLRGTYVLAPGGGDRRPCRLRGLRLRQRTAAHRRPGLFASGATVRAVAVGSRAQFLAMNRVIEANRIRPVIDRVFAFDDAPDAYRHYASGVALGRVVVTV